MSESAVEERVETPTQPEVPATTVQDHEAAAAPLEPVDGTASEAEGTATEGEFDPAAFIREATGSVEAAKPDLPGEDPIEAAHKVAIGRAQAFVNGINSARDPQYVEMISPFLERNGLDNEMGKAIHSELIAPLTNYLLRNFNDYSSEALDEAFSAVLKEDAATAKHYETRKYGNRKERVLGVAAAAKAAADEEVLSQIKDGKHPVVNMLVQKTRDETIAALRKAGRLTDTDSEQRVNGTGPSSVASDDAKLLDPNVSQPVKDAILAKRGML